jgi:phosphocarrier protein
MLAVQEYLNCKISIHSKKGDSELNGILSLISLGLEKGDEVLVRADGENEREACARIADIFSNEFDFPSMDEQENVNVFV